MIKEAEDTSDTVKLELLKHYLLNYILYSNLEEDEKIDSPILEKLRTITILIDKLVQMENKLQAITSKRVVDKKMMKNKGETKKSRNRVPPQTKYSRNAKRLLERTKEKEDFNIDVKKSKSNKLN